MRILLPAMRHPCSPFRSDPTVVGYLSVVPGAPQVPQRVRDSAHRESARFPVYEDPAARDKSSLVCIGTGIGMIPQAGLAAAALSTLLGALPSLRTPRWASRSVTLYR